MGACPAPFSILMFRTGVANLPLHGGSAPKWLFERMVRLSREITEAVILEYGPEEFLQRMSNPFWFQAFACVLGFDYHSSGTTTVTLGALKEALSENELGLAVCGGKGKASRKTPQEIGQNSGQLSLSTSKSEELIYASRLSAKVDSSCVQDGYQLYHHVFIFTEHGDWCVVQQGMNLGGAGGGRAGNIGGSRQNGGYARRYHWLSGFDSFVEEPHSAVCCDSKSEKALDLTARESSEARKTSVDLINDNPEHLKKYFSSQTTLLELSLPAHHPVLDCDISPKGWDILKRAYELQPKNYEELVSLQGIGPKKLRALALLSDLLFGAKASWEDPVKYSFSHGGKDGFPYPVDRQSYDHSVSFLREALANARIGRAEKLNALRRLDSFVSC